MAYIYPGEFLQGLFDSEGSIRPNALLISGYTLDVTIGNSEVLSLATKLLKKLGYRTKTSTKPPKTRVIDNRIVHFKQCYRIRILGGKQTLHKFAAEIGFREGMRRRKLAALLEALKHPPKERRKIYRQFLNSFSFTR